VASLWRTTDQLDTHQVAVLVDAASSWSLAHQVEALPEQVMRALEAGDPAWHLISDEPTSYAQAEVRGGDLEMFAFGGDPSDAQLLAARELAGEIGLELRAWRRHVRVHDAMPLDGFVLERSILLLERPLPFERTVDLPPGVRLEAFRTGVDEAAWLHLNAAAFADHPEQGDVDLIELHRREVATWFDPNGFLMAWEGEQLVGACWTKLHRGVAGLGGEIYVIGIAPSAQGRGLGRILVEEGLHHLTTRGADHAVLFVEADNLPALHLYEALGFSERSRDECWRAVRYPPEEPTARPTP